MLGAFGRLDLTVTPELKTLLGILGTRRCKTAKTITCLRSILAQHAREQGIEANLQVYNIIPYKALQENAHQPHQPILYEVVLHTPTKPINVLALQEHHILRGAPTCSHHHWNNPSKDLQKERQYSKAQAAKSYIYISDASLQETMQPTM